MIDDSASLISLCFIALQNYINNIIADLLPSCSNKHDYYNLENTEKYHSLIDLLNSLANFTKHKEEGNHKSQLNEYTVKRLKKYELNCEQSVSEILNQGLFMLNKDYDML